MTDVGENPFSIASMTSLYADDDSVAERRRQLFKLTNTSSDNRDVEKRDTWWCGRSRTFWVIAFATAGAVMALALSLGLGLGLGLRKKREPEGDLSDYVEYFPIEVVPTASVPAAAAEEVGQCALCSAVDVGLLRLIDARATSAAYTMRLGAFGAAEPANTIRCSDACPIYKLSQEAQRALSNSDGAAVVVHIDNADYHTAWMNQAIHNATESTEPVSYPFPGIGDGDETLRRNLTSLSWPGNPDDYVSWSGSRFNHRKGSMTAGTLQYAVCQRAGAVNVTNDDPALDTATQDKLTTPLSYLCARLRTVYNNSWYAETLTEEILADSANAPLDNTVGFSATYNEVAGAGSCEEYPGTSSNSSSYLHLWTDRSTSTYYHFHLFNDSITITPNMVNTVDFFSAVLLSCRCPAGAHHRFMGVDSLTVSFKEYHDCVLSTVSYHMPTNTAANGHSLIREYAIPTTMVGIGPKNQNTSALGAATCARFNGEDLVLASRCAFYSGVNRRYSSFTEGNFGAAGFPDVCASIAC